MFNPFGQLEKNLGRAGLLLLLTLAGAIALSFVLLELGHDTALAILAVLAAMPFVAWLMSKAATVQGRNRWLYGLASLLPPLAVLLFFSLFNHALADRTHAATRRET